MATVKFHTAEAESYLNRSAKDANDPREYIFNGPMEIIDEEIFILNFRVFLNGKPEKLVNVEFIIKPNGEIVSN